MPRPTPPPAGPLAEAAARMEDDVKALESAVGDAQKVRLDTRKNVDRCARDLQRAAELHEAIGRRVAELSVQLRSIQDRTAAAVETLRTVGATLAARQQGYAERMTVFQTLGEEAIAIGALAQSGPEAADEVRGRLEALAARAGEIATEARSQGYRDLAEEASGREQQLRGLAGRLG